MNDKACLTVGQRMAENLFASTDERVRAALALIGDASVSDAVRIGVLAGFLGVAIKEGWDRGYEAGKK